MADVHRPAKGIVIPDTAGMPGYYTTVCGKRLDASALAITDQASNVTCARCKGKK